MPEASTEKAGRGWQRLGFGLFLVAVVGLIGYGARHLSFFSNTVSTLSPWGVWAFLLVGLLIGVSHCVGMCWPFVLFLSGQHPAATDKRTSQLLPQLMYNLGRTVTYTLLGALAGALGGLIGMGGSLLGIQKAAAMLAGGVLLIYGSLGLVGIYTPLQFGQWAPIQKLTRGLMQGKAHSPFIFGLILGLLPCGPLYAVLLAAAALAHPLQGALALALFGLGTIPAMLLLSLVGKFLTERGSLRALSYALVLVMGAFFVYHGLTAAPALPCH